MVQREVGERLAAEAGGKSYGVLSVLLGVYAEVTRLFHVGPEQFMPKPAVDSLVLRLDFHKTHIAERPSFRFFKSVVNLAFQQRRKTLRNSLKSLIGNDFVGLDQALATIGIDLGCRPEALSPQEFFQFAGILQEFKDTSTKS